MIFNFNAVKAGVGLFSVFGLSLGILIFLVISSSDPDDPVPWAFFLGALGFVAAMIVSPILSTIVGAIISKDFDEESDAVFNGAISGAIGTFFMMLICILFLIVAIAATEESDDGSGSNDDPDDDSDAEFGELFEVAVKGLLPSAVGGAIGAFAGFRFLWSPKSSSVMTSSNMVSSQPVVAQPVVAQPVVAQPVVIESVSVVCPSCSFEIQVQKLGRLQYLTCGNCGMPSQIKI